MIVNCDKCGRPYSIVASTGLIRRHLPCFPRVVSVPKRDKFEIRIAPPSRQTTYVFGDTRQVGTNEAVSEELAAKRREALARIRREEEETERENAAISREAKKRYEEMQKEAARLAKIKEEEELEKQKAKAMLEAQRKQEEEKRLEYERRRRAPREMAYQLHFQTPEINHYWMNDCGDSGVFRQGYEYRKRKRETSIHNAYGSRKCNGTTTETDEEADKNAEGAKKAAKLIERTDLEIIWPLLHTVTKAEEEAYAALRRYEKRLLTTKYTGHYDDAIKRINQTIRELKAQKEVLAARQIALLQKSGWFGPEEKA